MAKNNFIFKNVFFPNLQDINVPSTKRIVQKYSKTKKLLMIKVFFRNFAKSGKLSNCLLYTTYSTRGYFTLRKGHSVRQKSLQKQNYLLKLIFFINL